MASLKITGKEPNQSYEQPAAFGSWRDMQNTGLRNEFMRINKGAKEKDLPKDLRGTVKANYCPEDDTAWLTCENKACQQVVHLDADGFVTYTYMESKWVGSEKHTYKREQFTYLLCTH